MRTRLRRSPGRSPVGLLRLVMVLLSALLLPGCALSACGLETNYVVPYDVQPGLIKPVPQLRGATFVVGSKDFTENIILGYMSQYALSAAGAEVQDLTNIQGSNSNRQALLTEDIDLTWDYTGTGWLSYLGHDKAVADPQKQFEVTAAEDLRENKLVWLPYSPLNDVYAFAAKQSFADKHNLKTTSDMVELIKKQPELGTVCVETEFASRPDGLPGAEKTYGFEVTQGNLKTLGTGAIYESIGSLCNFGEVFTTDGRVLAKNLALMTDDKKAFPPYNASPVLRKDTMDKYPQVRQVLGEVSKRLDNETMRRLGAQVDVQGVDAAVVARNWMVQQGLVKYNGGD